MTKTGGMLDSVNVFLAAGEVVSGALQDYKLEIAFTSEEFTMNAVVTDNEGVQTATSVTSIDGQVGVLFSLVSRGLCLTHRAP